MGSHLFRDSYPSFSFIYSGLLVCTVQEGNDLAAGTIRIGSEGGTITGAGGDAVLNCPQNRIVEEGTCRHIHKGILIAVRYAVLRAAQEVYKDVLDK